MAKPTNEMAGSATNSPATKTHKSNSTRRQTGELVKVSADTLRSTAVEAQRQRIVDALRTGPKTSHDLRKLGCYQAPARVKELRDRFNFNIETERVTLYDSWGYMHPNAARYHLHEITVKFGGAQ